MNTKKLTLSNYQFAWAGPDGRFDAAAEMVKQYRRDGCSLQFMEASAPDSLQLEGNWFPVLARDDGMILWAVKRDASKKGSQRTAKAK